MLSAVNDPNSKICHVSGAAFEVAGLINMHHLAS